MCKGTHRKVQETMATLGSRLVRLRPLFCHPQRSIEMSLHGDDFFVPGEPVDLVWMKNELESKLEINTTIVGTDQGCRGR